MIDFLEYVQGNADRMLSLGLEHLVLVLVGLGIGTVVGVGVGLLTYRVPAARTVALSGTGLLLVVPSLAMYAVLVPFLGLGSRTVVAALALYSLLPIVRNTIAGLTGVDPAVVESAQGVGMGRVRRLLQIELPLAWPVVLTGVRVSGVLLVGIAALATIVGGGGYGELIFAALRSITGPNALNLALAGTLGVVAVGLLLDLAFLALTRLTTPRGIR